MGKRKKNRKSLNYILFAVLAALLLIWLFLPKLANFQKTIPDAVELPKDVQESIKNLKPQKTFKLPILLYHYVEYVKDDKDTVRISLNIIPYIFDSQVKTLKDAGYHFVTLADLANALDDKTTLNPKSVILTFDDGYRDFYTDVFPILKKYQIKAVAFVVPNFLNKPNNMDTWQLKEIAESGLVEIGAHTMAHTYLVSLPVKRVDYEIVESKKYLEKLVGHRIVSFAYPYGAFDNIVIDAVKKAGFKTAVTTIDGVFAQDINRFFLYRVRPGLKTGEDLVTSLRNPNF